MQSVLETIKSIDKGSKELLLRNFDRKNINILAKESPNLLK